MKMYDKIESSISETLIDPSYKMAGLRDGFLIERDATLEEELAECHRLRVLAYPSLNEQADALYKSRQGDDDMLKAIDERIAAVKEMYPKPVVSTSLA